MGAKVIGQLTKDLHGEFPNMAGFSPGNLKYMRAFAEAWPESPDERLWYVWQATANGWSRNVLVLRIESGRPVWRSS